MFRRSRRLAAAAAVLLAPALLLTACGSDDDGNGRRPTIRFAFAPDPVIDYLNDTGKLAELEDKWNVRLQMTSSWDEFTFFAGGHGDIVSTASYELPLLEKETNIETVTFGKYSRSKLMILVKKDSPYQNFSDLKGKKIAVGSPVGGTLVWGAYAKKTENVDFLFKGGDYRMVLNDHATNPELVARGEVQACVCPVNLAAKQLRSGELRGLFDNATSSDFYGQKIAPGHLGVMENVFTARKDWYDKHPREVAFFLALWEEGVKQWKANKAKIVKQYPQHFAVEDDADIAWMADYMKDNDWTADTVYLDDKWVSGEQGVFSLMKDTGFMEKDAGNPVFKVVSLDDVSKQSP